MAGSVVSTPTIHRGRGISRLAVNFTTDASGDATVTTVGGLYGKLVGVAYDAGDLATGVDITVKDAATGATIFSLTNAGTSDRHIRPTAVITDNAGAAVTAADTAPNVNRDIFLFGKITVVVAQGGNAKSGGLDFIVEEVAAAA